MTENEWPKFKGGKIIECKAMDEMEDNYEFLTPTSTLNAVEIELMNRRLADVTKQNIPYCITLKNVGGVPHFRFYVQGIAGETKE